MKVLQYSFLVLTLAVALLGIAPDALAQTTPECQSVTYSATGGPTYNPATCAPTNACPSFAGTAGSFPCAPTTATGLIGIINKVFTTMFIFLVTIASFTLLYAAFLYVTSEGEQEKINTAKKIIIYAVVALIVAALAFGAPRAIQSFITT